MGEDIPVDEINLLPINRTSPPNYGYPYCHGFDVQDSDMDFIPCSEFTLPIYGIPAHSAALGAVFYTGNKFPNPVKTNYTLFIAEHGSWNRRVHVGYRVSIFDIETKTYLPFITGWLQDEYNRVFWGRPVDVINSPDGSIFISDDHAGAIYQVVYNPSNDRWLIFFTQKFEKYLSIVKKYG